MACLKCMSLRRTCLTCRSGATRRGMLCWSSFPEVGEVHFFSISRLSHCSIFLMFLLQVICGALAAACSGHLRDKVPTMISRKSVHQGICLHPCSQVVVRNGFAAVRFIMGWFRLPRVLQGTDSSGRVFRDAPSASGSRYAGDDFSLPLAEMISQDGLGSNMMVVGAMSQKAPWALSSSSYQIISAFMSSFPRVFFFAIF